MDDFKIKKKTPTKKIWMLADLEPSEAVSGGPWMGDRDLDEEFIKIMRTTIMRYLNKEVSLFRFLFEP